MKRLLLVLVLASACGPHDAESANLPGPRPPMMPPCETNADCDADAFCEVRTCGDINGICRSRTMCMPIGGAVCGCDHMTYPNDCERRAAGISGFTPGPCG